jgi:hypothetical protein
MNGTEEEEFKLYGQRAKEKRLRKKDGRVRDIEGYN